MNGYKIVLLKAILCFIGCRKVNGYAPEYVLVGIKLEEIYHRISSNTRENIPIICRIFEVHTEFIQ
mgnify:CR=1 FL=1